MAYLYDAVYLNVNSLKFYVPPKMGFMKFWLNFREKKCKKERKFFSTCKNFMATHCVPQDEETSYHNQWKAKQRHPLTHSFLHLRYSNRTELWRFCHTHKKYVHPKFVVVIKWQRTFSFRLHRMTNEILVVFIFFCSDLWDTCLENLCV